MDGRTRRSLLSGSSMSQLQQERKRVEEESLLDDDVEFKLPIKHRIEENLDRENLEQASVDTRISCTNVGFKLLQKMGWKGKGLGKEEQGIVEPIKAGMRDPKLGIGKQEEDDFYTAEENVQRKRLEVEVEETEEMAKKREADAERELKLQSEVKEILRPFYCQLCNKQYKIAMEYETHLSSYDHNHRKRFKEMKALQSGNDRDDRKKREQVRQEREMARMASKMEAKKQQKKDEGVNPLQPQEKEVPPVMPLAGPQIKFGFGGSKPVQTKKAMFGGLGKKGTLKKPKVDQHVANVFGDDSEDG